MKFYIKQDIRRGTLVPEAWIWHGKILGRNQNEYGFMIRFPWYTWRKRHEWLQSPYSDDYCMHQPILRIHNPGDGPEKYEWFWGSIV